MRHNLRSNLRSVVGMQASILIVDDESSILLAMEDYFSASGYEVKCARNRKEAELLLAQRDFAALITDLRLTGSDDAEGLAIAALAPQQYPGLYIILITAYGSPELQRSLSTCGIDVCLAKPTPLDEIARVLSRVLETAA